MYCHIHNNTDVQPIIDAPLKTPFILYDNLHKELNNICDLKVIEKITTPTSCISSILLVVKNNKKLRICLDPRNLNKVINTSHYPLPSFETIKTQLTGSKYYSTLDANSRFWMIILDELSTSLCTFNTPSGRYKFLRLPYGLNCTPEVLHLIITELFSDIECVIVYIDDLFFMGSAHGELNTRIKNVFNRAREVNLKFNKNKRHIGTKEIKIFGHVFNSKDIRPDPNKIKAIELINYLSSYVPNIRFYVNYFKKIHIGRWIKIISLLLVQLILVK